MEILGEHREVVYEIISFSTYLYHNKEPDFLYTFTNPKRIYQVADT